MTTIGFIGAGQMARALASGFVAAERLLPNAVSFCDPSPAAAAEFLKAVDGAQQCAGPHELVDSSDVVFLAVKPQHVDSVFDGIEQASDKLFISIAAGITIDRLSRGVQSQRVIRVMPNTPCLVGAGAAGYCRGEAATVEDGQFVGELLNAVGVAFELPEKLLDAVTGLSGSGPAFVYQFIEAMSDGGVRVGLPRDIATRLAAQTVLGAAKMVLDSGDHPGVLKDRVTSPGGTTIAGLHALETGGLRGTVMNAIQAATERSQELG